MEQRMTKSNENQGLFNQQTPAKPQGPLSEFWVLGLEFLVGEK